jgi:copper oxidase (laccase) domain-containing protein
MLVDPVRRVAANIHSGWRGSIVDIAGAGVETMHREFGCDPEEILACVSPSLGPCCAEFVHYEKEIPEHLWPYRDRDRRFDFWAMTRDQLLARGLQARNIEISGICTRCRPDLFFSYRHAPVTGRFASVIGFSPRDPHDQAIASGRACG